MVYCRSSWTFPNWRGGSFSFLFSLAIGISVVFSSLPVYAAAPPVVSQVISVSHPLKSEFGNVLKGTDPDSGYFGIPAVQGDLVHIYLATDGHRYDPNVHGEPDPRNILLHATRIGIGAAINEAQPGVFSAHLSPRPAGGSKIFVRVFNAPSLEQASFYQDSQLFTVSWSVNETFFAVFSAVEPLDDADDDGDGLHNSWERSYGTNPNMADTDGDGFSDWEELLAGTDPTQADSRFVVTDILPIPPSHMRLSWISASNRVYTVERSVGSVEAGEYVVVGEVHGNGLVMEFMASSPGDGPSFFRVRVEPIMETE